MCGGERGAFPLFFSIFVVIFSFSFDSAASWTRVGEGPCPALFLHLQLNIDSIYEHSIP
jgi:hypothetical protein